ncbi:glutathione S-transferase N-terminal domain-containing protein [Halegenticoccus tardaugens]|uniref:glutathione S-transferase N-terminal domain-containing protein n=1 Tax=Halegenticoccus tardaugens TaxID=2071624 RepID=UPI00100B6112|nr:glutathione S-transferase N-terminal domain-containing protein [Halegenticoccus tardaugens]
MLELYQAEGCPYSENVREKLSELGVSYVAHNPRTHDGDVLNEGTHGELTALGGRDQIPYLVDHRREEAMYESDDIVAYLDEHYG